MLNTNNNDVESVDELNWTNTVSKDDKMEMYKRSIVWLEKKLKEFDNEIRSLLPNKDYSASNYELLAIIWEERLLSFLQLQQVVFFKKILVLNYEING